MAFRRPARRGKAPTPPAAAPRFRPRLEALEGREVPAVLMVTTLGDTFPGSLRNAISTAQANDTITFAPGLSGIITLTAGQELLLNKNLTIQGPGASVLIVSGLTPQPFQPTPRFRVFDVSAGVTVAISGLTITQGLSPTTGPTANQGGAVYNAGTLDLSGCTLVGNSAGTSGGGIFNAATGTLSIESSSIAGNSAIGGGGLFNNGGMVSMTASTFAGNIASGVAGGAGLLNAAGGTLSVDSCTITNNQDINPNSTGGGLANAGTATLRNSTFSGQVASFGGGLFNTASGTLTATACTIAGNGAITNGGGLFVEAGAGTVNLTNTIVAGNFKGGTTNDVFGAVDPSSANNLIGDGTNLTGISAGSGGNLIGTAGAAIDPRLGPLQFNGGTTQTRALLPGSPAINAGGSSGAAVDQRGASRAAKPQLDIGAVGYGLLRSARAYAVATGAFGGQVNVYSADGNLRFALTPYPGFTGGVQVAVGDVIGDGRDYIVTAPNAGGTPEVHVYDGTTGALLSVFEAYSTTFTGGVTLTLANPFGPASLGPTESPAQGALNIITAPGRGGAPEVRIFTAQGTLLKAFNAFDPGFSGGIHIAAGDTSGGGYANLVVVPGAGGTPEVRVFDGRTLALKSRFNAYDLRFTGGLTVAVGDTEGQGYANIITAPGRGGSPEIHVYDGQSRALLKVFNAFPASYTSGVTLATGDLIGQGRANIIVVPGPAAPPEVRIFDTKSLSYVNNVGKPVIDFTAFPPSFKEGMSLLVRDTSDQGYADVIVARGSGGPSNVRVYDLLQTALLQDYLAFDMAFTAGVVLS